MTADPTIVIVGGAHDGTIGTIGAEAVRLRFVVMEQGDWWHGYYWDGAEVDDAGRLVFRPPNHEDADR